VAEPPAARSHSWAHTPNRSHSTHVAVMSLPGHHSLIGAPLAGRPEEQHRDPTSEAVSARGREENFGEGLLPRCRLVAEHYAPVHGMTDIELGRRGTTLYKSIHRVDGEMIINSHVWGMAVFEAPVRHLRHDEGGNLFDAHAVRCPCRKFRRSLGAVPSASRSSEEKSPVPRTEYFDGPTALSPNSPAVATSAVITDGTGSILLRRRTDSGNWALPAGGLGMTESPTDSVVRGIREETGLLIEVTGRSS
jgi:hypothetical protein